MPRSPQDKLRFALDQNFPVSVVTAFAPLMPHVELVPIATIDPGLADVADWELFVALHRDRARWDGLITNDDSLLKLPKEMTVLSQTDLSLVVAVGEGHSPIRAVGVLLCHLNHICHQHVRDRAQIWTLRVAQKSHEEPSSYLEKIAHRSGVTLAAPVEQHKLPAAELRREI